MKNLSKLPGGKTSGSESNVSDWRSIVVHFQKPALRHSLWQVTNSLGPYLLLWFLIWASLGISLWLTLGLAVLAAGFLVRIFIIFHDCGHGSFFASRRANHILGFITGVLTFTPYHHWRWEHARHHATSGDLDKRGVGDIWTLTVREYLESTRWKRFAYRMARNPMVLLLFAPLFLFLVQQRFSSPNAGTRERSSVHWTNLAILIVAGGMSWALGIQAYLLIQLTVMAVSGAAGVWLFYVQHQFEGVYWERGDDWDFATAALKGSSFYRLPKVLQWFSGNIGFHHIHHLSSRIPNYHLESCHQADPLFQTVKPVTVWSSLRSLTFRLWDEEQHRLVGFGHLRKLQQKPDSATS